jgi:hypothetical protein
LTVAVPVEPLEMLPPWSAKTCGRLLSRFSTLLTPSILMSVAVTCVIGLVLVRFGEGMREPVTWVGARMIAGGVWRRPQRQTSPPYRR